MFRVGSLPAGVRLTGPLLALCLGSGLSAQSALSGWVGASVCDLSGTGTGAAGALRLDLPLSASTFLELGSAVVSTTTAAGRRDNLLLPEAGVRVAFPVASQTGYVVAGAGAHVTVRTNRDAELTLFAGAGLEFAASDAWGVRTETRARSINPWGGFTVDLMLGLSRRFGRR